MASLRFVAMSDTEYETWARAETLGYAAEHVRTGQWSKEEATARATAEFRTLLPKGLETPGQYLYVLEDPSTQDRVGFVWFQAGAGPRPDEPPRAYVYDIVVQPAFRGRGYGEAAMRLVEESAKKLGFHTLGLHVFGHNTVARSLYEKLGYVPTNIVMKKDLGD
jgi:ribosomal protein S18 acetylase RimI-like enzyme